MSVALKKAILAHKESVDIPTQIEKPSKSSGITESKIFFPKNWINYDSGPIPLSNSLLSYSGKYVKMFGIWRLPVQTRQVDSLGLEY